MHTDTRPAYIKWVYAAAAAIVLGSAGLGMDDPSAQDEDEATAASLQDALTQAQADRPDLWDTVQKERARVAAGVVARYEVGK